MPSLAAGAEEISPRLIILYRVTNGHFTFILRYTYPYTFITLRFPLFHAHTRICIHPLPLSCSFALSPEMSGCKCRVYVHDKDKR